MDPPLHQLGKLSHSWLARASGPAGVMETPAEDTLLAKLCNRYHFTAMDIEPEIRNILEELVPALRNLALWLLGEAGKCKTPLGRIIAMMFSRIQCGIGAFRTSADVDFFNGVPFAKCVPALRDIVLANFTRRYVIRCLFVCACFSTKLS